MAWIETFRDLRQVEFDGRGFRALGATVEVLGTRDCRSPPAWSRALHDHRGQPDGIYYPRRHDSQAYAIALSIARPTPSATSVLAAGR